MITDIDRAVVLGVRPNRQAHLIPRLADDVKKAVELKCESLNVDELLKADRQVIELKQEVQVLQQEKKSGAHSCV